MPIHDWRRVEAGIFHDFHHEWISTIKHALNGKILSSDHYALIEQQDSTVSPDVLNLDGRARIEADIYAAKANHIVIRHVSDHRVVAVIEIVSPGNKSTRGGIRTFIKKAAELLRGGIHLLVIDPFPPGPRDPQGIHKLIWEELDASDFVLPKDHPLTMVSYIGGASQEALIEPIALGSALPDMPLFLSVDIYVTVPLELAYQAAWNAVPEIWQEALTEK